MTLTQNGALQKDDNGYPVMGGTSSVDNTTVVNAAIDPVTRRLLTDQAGSGGTVTSVSVVSANGFAGTVSTATTTPAITLSTTITGLLKGNGTAISAATSGTDYSAGTSGLATGILKSTTTTGALTIAVAGDFPTLNQNTTGSAATLTTTRTIWGQNFNGSANVTGDITLGTGNITMTGSIAATGARVTKGWFTDIESTNMPTVGGTSLSSTFAPIASPTFTGTVTAPQIVNTNNAITASGNAATVPITSRLSTVTNNSAATLTITITTTSAVDGQMVIVRVLDFSAVAQTITWVNTENSTVTAPTTSNGSTTLPLTVGFMYNSATSKWRCIASA